MNKVQTYWLLTTEYPPLSGGGISTYCLETANMFADEGDKITVFIQDFSVQQTKEELEGNKRIVRFNPDNFYTAAFLGYEANLSYAFAQVVGMYVEREGAPDFVEAQEYLGIAYYLLQYKHLNYPGFRDLKVVITLHSPSFLYLEFNQVSYHKLPNYWVGEMERSCIVSADILISPSAYLIRAIQKRMDLGNKEIHVLPNPYQPKLAEQLSTPVVPITRIHFLGKLTPQKGCLELISWMSQLWKNDDGPSLIMIGGGNHLYHPEGIDMAEFIRKKYKKEIRDQRLTLVGSIRPDQLDSHLQSSQVIVVPSVVDNLPYTVLESMARGKIVLASVQGGQAEIINDGIDGFVFDHDDTGSFEEQLKRIMSLTPAQIQQVGLAAINKTATYFNYKRICAAKKNVLQQAVAVSPVPLFPFIRNSQPWNGDPGTANYDNPLLSVVVPYFNMHLYVEDAVRSVVASTYKNIEIVLVNDGSDAPETDEVMANLERKYSVRVIRKVNEGLSNARNTGATFAKGPLLAFLDPDDTIEPTYFAKAIEVLQTKKNVMFVGCWARYFGNAQGYWPAFNPEPPYLLFHNMINSSAVICRKQAFVKFGFNDSRMVFGMEDYESIISLVENGCYGIVLPEPLWNYRIRKGSLARAFTREKQLYLYRLISQKHSSFYSQHATELINLVNANGPGIDYDNPTLLWDMPGSKLLNQKIKRKLVAVIKSNSILRKSAIHIKRKLKK